MGACSGEGVRPRVLLGYRKEAALALGQRFECPGMERGTGDRSCVGGITWCRKTWYSEAPLLPGNQPGSQKCSIRSSCLGAVVNESGTMRLRVRTLALLSGLRIWHRRELWCGSQRQLGSHIAVALAWAGGYSSD